MIPLMLRRRQRVHRLPDRAAIRPL